MNKTPLTPSNPDSLLCRLRRHNYQPMLHIKLSMGGIDYQNTVLLDYCIRCGDLKMRHGRGLILVQLEDLSPEHWDKMIGAIKK